MQGTHLVVILCCCTEPMAWIRVLPDKVVVLIALGTYFMDKGGEDRSIMSALKGLGMLVVGIGIVLILYFIFEDWVISQFGVSVCAAAIR